MPPFVFSLVVVGCAGGLLPDVLRLIKHRYQADIPAYLQRPNFWLGVVLLAAIGGLAAWALAAGTARDALIYGYAAPQLFSELVGGATVARPERGGGEPGPGGAPPPFSLLRWWAG